MRNRFVQFVRNAMKPRKITNHPLAIMLLPIDRRLPILLLNFLPAGRVPPTKILITTGVNEFEILAVAYGRSIEKEVLQKDRMLWLLVIESEIITFGVRRPVAAFSS